MAGASYNSWPAKRHAAPALLASALTTGQLYKCLVWNVSGVADVCDAFGTSKKVVTVPGGVYPCQNYGVITGGNTTLSQGDFLGLYDG